MILANYWVMQFKSLVRNAAYHARQVSMKRKFCTFRLGYSLRAILLLLLLLFISYQLISNHASHLFFSLKLSSTSSHLATDFLTYALLHKPLLTQNDHHPSHLEGESLTMQG